MALFMWQVVSKSTGWQHARWKELGCVCQQVVERARAVNARPPRLKKQRQEEAEVDADVS